MIKRSKYLSEIMKERNIEIEGNTLIVSPCGSGKTHYIINDLCKGKTCLYLCDTTNLKTQVLKEEGTTLDFSIEGTCQKSVNIDNISVMTYHKFGSLIKYNNDDFIRQFDIIIGDECHNLIDYQSFDDTHNLERATETLIRKHEGVDIIFFTATPLYLDIMCERYSNFDKFFNCIDFSDDKEIKRYTEKRKAYINHYTDVEKYLIEYDNYFKFMDGKCLIYTTTIDNMKKLEDICARLKLRPICIWSLSNKENLMIDEQLKVREHLLNNGELLEPYNVLIINRATETGVNIYDKKMELMIANTSNEVQQIQARNRIRHDIDLLVLKTDDVSKLRFSIDNRALDKWLTKETVIQEIIVRNNMRDDRGRVIKVNKLNDYIINNGYKIESKKKMIKGVRIVMYIISKVNK